MPRNKRSHVFLGDGSSITGGVYTDPYGGEYQNISEALKDTRTNINYQATPSVTLKSDFGTRGNYIGGEVDMLKLIDKFMKKKGK